MPDDVTAVPNMQYFFKGIIHMRDSVIPLLDLRILYGSSSVEEEIMAFREMLEARKQDHVD